MRYFLVSVTALLDNEHISNTFTLKSGKFPSIRIIKSMALDYYDKSSNPTLNQNFNILIHNIFEFKDERDYSNYHEKEIEPLEKEMD